LVGSRKSWNIEKRQKIENLYKLIAKFSLTHPILMNIYKIQIIGQRIWRKIILPPSMCKKLKGGEL